MKAIIDGLPQQAKDKYKENKIFFKKLKKKPPKDLDYIMHELHEETFEQINCLECANCCRTTGPLFTDKDIERISKFMRLKPSQFIDRYLRIDEDQDYVLKTVPCTFLADDNYCSIYEVRPKACREYPHTDRNKFHQITDLTLKNTAICPAAFDIVEKLKKTIKI